MHGPRRRRGGARTVTFVAAALLILTGCRGGNQGEGKQSASRTGPGGMAGMAGKTEKARTVARKVPPVPRPARARWRLTLVNAGLFSLGGIANDGAGHWVVAQQRAVERWSARTGQPVSALKLKDGGDSLAVAPGGKRVALGHSRGRVELLTFDGQPSKDLPKLADWVTDVAFDAAGARLAAVSQDGVLRVYDVATGKALHTAKSPENNGFYSVAFLPKSQTLVVGGYKQLHLFDRQRGVFTRSLPGPGDAIRSLSFSFTGDRLIAASKQRAWILETKAWAVVKRLPGGRAPVAFGPKGKWLAVGGAKRELVLYGVAKLNPVARLHHAAPPWRLAFSPGGDALLVATRQDSTVYGYRFDRRPDLGVRVARLQWFDDDGPTLYATLSVVGKLPRDTVAYGRLSGLKATVAGGGAVTRITAPPQQADGLEHRDRVFPGTSHHGFQLNLRLHGIPAGARRLARLEGSFLMRVARTSAILRFESVDRLLGKPLSHPVLKKMGLQVTVKRRKGGKGLVVTHQGKLGQLESVSLLDPQGKARECSKERVLTYLPTWTFSAAPESFLGWKLSLRVNADTHFVRGHFDLTGIEIPPRKKERKGTENP